MKRCIDGEYYENALGEVWCRTYSGWIRLPETNRGPRAAKILRVLRRLAAQPQYREMALRVAERMGRWAKDAVIPCL